MPWGRPLIDSTRERTSCVMASTSTPGSALMRDPAEAFARARAHPVDAVEIGGRFFDAHDDLAFHVFRAGAWPERLDRTRRRRVRRARIPSPSCMKEKTPATTQNSISRLPATGLRPTRRRGPSASNVLQRSRVQPQRINREYRVGVRRRGGLRGGCRLRGRSASPPCLGAARSAPRPRRARHRRRPRGTALHRRWFAPGALARTSIVLSGRHDIDELVALQRAARRGDQGLAASSRRGAR